jgi:hypothetical protein
VRPGKMSKSITAKVQLFINKCLRKILRKRQRPKELKRPGQRSKVIPRIKDDGGVWWKPYVLWKNDRILLLLSSSILI